MFNKRLLQDWEGSTFGFDLVVRLDGCQRDFDLAVIDVD